MKFTSPTAVTWRGPFGEALTSLSSSVNEYPVDFSVSELMYTFTFDLVMTTPAARIRRSQFTSFASIVVCGIVILQGSVYGSGVTPAGTPVLDRLGQEEVAAE